MPPPPVPSHIPTSDELDAHLVEKIAADGLLTVIDKNSDQLVQVKVGILEVGGVLTLVAVGPGSG